MLSRKNEKTAVLYVVLCVVISGVAASAMHPKEKCSDKKEPQADAMQVVGETFFSNPRKGKDCLPLYKNELKPGDKIRIYIQAGTPDLNQLRMIPSLKGKQRDEAVKSYEKWRQDTKPLNDEFNELRRKMPAPLIERMLSQEEPQMDAKTKSEDFELLLKARSMLQKLRSNRLSVWQEVQEKLTANQLEELDSIKSGKVPQDLMTESAQEVKNAGNNEPVK